MVLGQRPALELSITDLSLEDPALHTDHTVIRTCLGKAVFDLGSERMQRHSAVPIPLASAHLGAPQTTRTLDSDTLGAELHRGNHRLLHGSPKCDSTFELSRDVFRDKLGVELRLTNLLDIDEDVSRREGLEFLAKVVESRRDELFDPFSS